MREIRATALYDYDNFNGNLTEKQKISAINTILDSIIRNKKLIIFENLVNPDTLENFQCSDFIDFEQTRKNIKLHFRYDILLFDKENEFDIELICAYYGVDDGKWDMTYELKRYLEKMGGEINFLMNNEIFGDPLYGVRKSCYLALLINNKIINFKIDEYEHIDFTKKTFVDNLFRNFVIEPCEEYKYPEIFINRIKKCIAFK